MSNEFQGKALNGWASLVALLLAGVGIGFLIAGSVEDGQVSVAQLVTGLVASVLWFVMLFGFFTLQPNLSAVLILMGAYKGTVKRSGFWWANPLLVTKKVSLRAHNLDGQKLKVNDCHGNPIEISAVVVWRVVNTAQACFDVENCTEYVRVQSESAVRQLASRYAYDSREDEKELTLRGSTDEVCRDLQVMLSERLSNAGVAVDEARLNHLAYAPEIAGAMLQRQQADAIVAARRRIVDGAVGMVEMALAQLQAHNTVQLDDERKAAMVSNLLVVLCGDWAAHPVVNAGTLYN